MADKLAVYNQALIHLEKPSLAALTDDIEARYVLDGVWTGAVEEAFCSADWNAFKKSVELVESVTGTAALGWTFVYDYPADYLRTVTVSNRPDFTCVDFKDYADEDSFLHTNTQPLYLRYISNSKIATVGSWPTMFWRYVALKLAFDACGKLTSGTTLEQKIEAKLDKAFRLAKSVDARNENNKRIATGSWARSRRGGYDTGYSDGNSGGTLVGGEITPGEGDV